MSIRHTAKPHYPQASVLKTPPTSQAVLLSTLKDHLRLDDSELPILSEFLLAATEAVETQIGCALITQTWEVAMDQWPSGGNEPWWDGVRQASITILQGHAKTVDLPRWPLQSVTSVKTFDEDDTETDVNIADTFYVDTFNRPGGLTLRSGSTWPTATRNKNAIIIEYVAGYGADYRFIPPQLAAAVRMTASYLYEHRGDGCSAGDALRDSGAMTMLSQFEVKRI